MKLSNTDTSHLAPTLAAAGASAGAIRYTSQSHLRRYMLMYALAIFSIAAVWGGVGSILLPLHVQQIELANAFGFANGSASVTDLAALKAQVASGMVRPGAGQQLQLDALARFDAARAGSLSLVMTVGVFVTMLMQPIAGLLSDRTRSRFGRRAPWIAAGGAITLGSLYLANHVGTIPALAAVWALAGIGTNMAAGPLAATIPDRVPAEKIGAISAIAGLGILMGFASGTVLGGALFNRIGTGSYLVFGSATALLCLLFLKFAPDRSSAALAVERVPLITHLQSMTIALRSDDFRWLWTGKVAAYFSYAISTTFSVYMLQSYVYPALSQQEAARIAPMIHLAALPGTLIAMYVAGKWSDAIGRRKPFVIGSSVLMACSMLIPLVWPTVPALFAQAMIGNIALGAFLVVDQALFIDVLPDKSAAGRDLGVSALGGNLGQALGPAIAGVIVAASGGYASIWPVAMMFLLFSGFTVLRIRTAR